MFASIGHSQGRASQTKCSQETLQACILDENTWGHLALHTGRLDTFEKVFVEVQAIARTRLGRSLLVPMDCSALKGKGKLKDAKGTGEGKRFREQGRNGRSSTEEPEKFVLLVRHGTSRLSVARRRVTMSSGGKQQWEDCKTRCQLPVRAFHCRHHHRYKHHRDSTLPPPSRHCTCDFLALLDLTRTTEPLTTDAVLMPLRRRDMINIPLVEAI